MAMRIKTEYLPATDTKGARIRVYGGGEQATYAYDYGSSNPHRDAAERFAGRPVSYVSEAQRGYVYETTE
jgi:hypothetical protein